MSSIGTPIGTPATTASRVRSAPVAAFATKTSVDVPPISNPMILSNPAHCAMRHAPTTPPAGPAQHRAHRLLRRQARRNNSARRLHHIHAAALVFVGDTLLQRQQITAPSAAQDTHSPPSSTRAHTRETPAESGATLKPESPVPAAPPPLAAPSSDSQTKTAG